MKLMATPYMTGRKTRLKIWPYNKVDFSALDRLEGCSERVWHYTTFDALEGIIADGHIKTSQGDYPAVWVSANPNWERGACKCLPEIKDVASRAISREDFLRHYVIPVRIEIDTAMVRLYSWKKLSSTPWQEMENAPVLKEVGIDPDQWYVSLVPIPTKAFKDIEFWMGAQWVSLQTKLHCKRSPCMTLLICGAAACIA